MKSHSALAVSVRSTIRSSRISRLHAFVVFASLLGSVMLFAPDALGAGSEKRLFRESRFIMGTSVDINVAQADPATAERAAKAAFAAMERVNLLMSNFRPESEISEITRQAGKREVRVSPETLEVIERAIDFGRLSEGAFDITVGPVFRLWNFTDGTIPDEAARKEALKRVDYRKVKVDPAKSTVFLQGRGMEVDLGAIAKGYAVDLACAALLQNGAANYLVKAGGEIKAHGEKEAGQPWTIGIQHPRLASELLAKVKVRSAAVSTSGDYEKFFLRNGERYHHLLNPATGLPAREAQSVVILAERSMDADALSTTVFVLGPEKGLSLLKKMPEVHALIVNRRGSVLTTPHWPEGVLSAP